jgi:hypothetical protein
LPSQGDRIDHAWGSHPDTGQLRPPLSEPRSDVQECRDADPTRRRIGNRKDDPDESRPRDTRREPTKKETREERGDGRSHEHKEAEVQAVQVVVCTVVTLVEVEQAEPGGEDEQSQAGYRHRAPPTAEEIAALHGPVVPKKVEGKGSAMASPAASAP